MLTPGLCPICASQSRVLLSKGSGFSFLVCHSCGVHVANPLPSVEELRQLYDGFHAGKSVHENFSTFASLARNFLESRLKIAREILGDSAPLKRFLDVGCGGGHCVHAGARMGLEAYGTEVDRISVAKMRARGVQNVLNAELGEAGFQKDFFDLVQIFHVLEHCRDPLQLIREARQVTRPSGLVVVDVPNQNSVMARAKVLLRFLGLRRGEWGYLQPPSHLYAFSPKALGQICERAGLQIRKVIFTSPLDARHDPVTAEYYKPHSMILTKLAYLAFGKGSYMSFFCVRSS